MYGLYIVFGFVFVGIVVLFAIYYSNAMKMTSYTEARVVSASEQVVRDEKERREETRLVCQYTVRGQDYTIEHTVRGMNAKSYPPGRKVTVWYNPNAPEMAKIKHA